LTLTEDFNYIENEEEKIIPANTLLSRDQIVIIVEKTKQHLLNKIRFGKLIIMTDEDADGAHIKGLILTLIANYFRYLFEEGCVYLAVAPLFRIQKKKEIVYIHDNYDLEEYRKKNKGNLGGTLQRFKGLGEMNPRQLQETTMDVEKRTLHKINFSDILGIRKIINDLMGVSSESRRIRLENGEHHNARVTIINNTVELKESLLVNFLSYAYKVIEERALPEEDGLKLVQRRLLYTFYELGLFPNKPYRKSAKIAGDVTGNYHPHGTESAYFAMVKLAQDFICRYPLVEGQGNFGSLDGDKPAHMRYTEARLTPFGAYLLEDIKFESTIN